MTHELDHFTTSFYSPNSTTSTTKALFSDRRGPILVCP